MAKIENDRAVNLDGGWCLVPSVDGDSIVLDLYNDRRELDQSQTADLRTVETILFLMRCLPPGRVQPLANMVHILKARAQQKR